MKNQELKFKKEQVRFRFFTQGWNAEQNDCFVTTKQ